MLQSKLISKLRNSLQSIGLIGTFLKILKFPRNYLKNQDFKNSILPLNSTQQKFHWIYVNNYWGNSESLSGSGSTLSYTKNLREKLPELLRQFNIQKVFDAPCGDFNWMKHLLPNVNINYVGGDIVKSLIDDLNKKYAKKGVSFLCIDLIKDNFPQADLMICRDCLFHLSYADTINVLRNYISSGIPFLLTTTHININNSIINSDISSGDFRLIDLYSPPYYFDSEPLSSIVDWQPPDPQRHMSLWSRNQIQTALSRFTTINL